MRILSFLILDQGVKLKKAFLVIVFIGLLAILLLSFVFLI